MGRRRGLKGDEKGSGELEEDALDLREGRSVSGKGDRPQTRIVFAQEKVLFLVMSLVVLCTV